MNDGTITIGTKVDTSGVDEGLNEIEAKVEKKDFTDKLSGKFDKLNSKFSSLGSVLGKAFKGLSGILKVLLGLALKIVGTILAVAPFITLIIGAVYVVSQAIDKVRKENTEIAQKVQYIVFVINQALAPAIEGVANFIAKVVNFVLNSVIKIIAYIGYIVKFLTGINIFKNAGIDKFQQSLQKADENTGNIKKNTGGVARNLKEARKQLAGFDEMNILSDTSSSGGTGGVNLGGLGGVGDLAQADFKLSEALDVNNIKIPQWLTDMMEFLTNPKQFLDPFTTFFKGTNFEFMGKGIADALNGVVDIFVGFQQFLIGVGETLIGIFTFNPEIIWDGIKKMVDGIGIILKGLIGIVVGVFETIVGAIAGVLKTIANFGYTYIVTPIVNAVKSLVTKIGSALSGIPNVFKTAFTNAKNKVASIWSNVSTLFSKGGKIFNGLKDGIVNTFKTIVNNLIKGINSVITKPFKELNKTLNGLRNTTILKQKPFKGLWKENPIPIPTIPTIKMAKGGIVNLPSRGVPLGNAIAGERGMEGVIPLTDSQQMALLGEAIGKYITINANITNTMNGRVLSRELQKIQNEEAFGSNRW